MHGIFNARRRFWWGGRGRSSWSILSCGLAACMALALGSTAAGAPAAPAADAVYAWYRGEDGLEANGSGRVIRWENRATSGTPATRHLDRISGTPEVVDFNTPYGVRTGVRCDGSDGVWATVANFGTLTGNRTFLAYCRLTADAEGFLFDGSANAPGLTRAQVRGGSWQVGLQPSGGGSNADTNTLPVRRDAWQAHAFTFERVAEGTRVTHRIRDEGTDRYTHRSTSGLGGLILGQNVAASRGLPVDVTEFLVYDRALPDAEVEDVLDYLAAKWGLPAEVPPPACTVVQTSGVVPDFGLHALLDVQVRGPGVLTNLTLTLEGTTDLGDIASLEVYGTGGTPEFRPLRRFGVHSGPLTGSLTISGREELGAGVNHVWVAVTPRRGAKWGHTLDAALLRVGLEAGECVPAVGAPPEGLTVGNGLYRTILRKAGDDGVHTYRIPGLVTTGRGTLIAVFDLRWDHAGDLPANVDVGCLRSTNQGNTWEWPPGGKAILDYDPKVAGSMGNGVGDPAILVDRQTGTIWVAALWSYGNRGYVGSGAGLATNQTGQVVLTRSDDDGITWSAPINITAQAKVNPNWGVCFQGPGHGIQLRDGTLLFPSQHTDPGGVNARAFFLYSTNRGTSWQASPDVNLKIPPQLNENQMVELNSGQILVSARAPSGGGGKRVWSTYTRGTTLGDGTWSSLRYDVPDPVCQASLVRLSSTSEGAPRNRLLFANPASASARVNLTVRMSEDEGGTWSVSRRVDPRPAAYSDLTVLNDGTVGLLYETGDSSAYETLTFVRFHLDWLTQADVDTDQDGLSDYYEGINGLAQGVQDGDLDTDGDGASNRAEFEAHTMANNARSVLRLESAAVIDEGLRLVWSTVPGVFYTLESAAELAPGWPLGVGTGSVLGVGPWLSHTVAVTQAAQGYFRVATPTRW